MVHMRDIRRGQPNRSAMVESHPGGTTLMIMVTSVPGKYADHWIEL